MRKRADATGDERSPRQRELVEAAARLFAERGYHAVGVADISGELGLSGPAFYRHFRSKQALLVAVMDESMTAHLEDVRDIVTTITDAHESLDAIVRGHVDFVFDQTGNIITWRTDFASLPPADRSRLRYLQRLYTEEWVRIVRRLRPDRELDQVRAMCHAAIALLQSPTEYSSHLPEPVHKALLTRMALQALDTAPAQPEADRLTLLPSETQHA